MAVVLAIYAMKESPFAAIQVDIPVFEHGEVVRILDDIVKVHSLQPGHGEWNDDMALVSMWCIAGSHTYNSYLTVSDLHVCKPHSGSRWSLTVR